MKKVSIIVPVYNSKKYIEKCIMSILNQTYKNLELILVDDESKDGSTEICKKYIKKDKRIRYFKKKNGGVSSARNYGIKKSTGDYIAFIDSDDYVDQNYIEQLVKNIRINTYARIANISPFEEEIAHDKTYTSDEFIKLILNNKYMGTCVGGLFEKKKIKAFDEYTSYMEDTIFLIEYLKKINNVKICKSDAKYYYLNNPESITRSENKVLKNINNFLYSLDQIDSLTNNKYKKSIERKKVILIEKELRFINNIDDFKKILEDDKINKSIDKVNNIFTIIFKFKNPYLLKSYYELRKKLKKIKNMKG